MSEVKHRIGMAVIRWKSCCDGSVGLGLFLVDAEWPLCNDTCQWQGRIV